MTTWADLDEANAARYAGEAQHRHRLYLILEAWKRYNDLIDTDADRPAIDAAFGEAEALAAEPCTCPRCQPPMPEPECTCTPRDGDACRACRETLKNQPTPY